MRPGQTLEENLPKRLGLALGRGVFRYALSLVLYGAIGVLVCVACYSSFAEELWSTMPGLPASRAGGFGALLALIVLLLHPAGYVSAVYLILFPVGFAILGHVVGLRSALAIVLLDQGTAFVPKLGELVWPAIKQLARLEATPKSHRAVIKLLSGDRPNKFPWLLRRALRLVHIERIATTAHLKNEMRAKSTKEPSSRSPENTAKALALRPEGWARAKP